MTPPLPVIIAAVWLVGFLVVATGYMVIARRDARRTGEQFSPFALSIISRLMLIIVFWPVLLVFWVVLKVRGEV